MGMSADAKLFYGFVVPEDHELPPLDEDREEDGGLDSILQRLRASVGFTETWTPEAKDYWKREGEADKRTGVEALYFGTDCYDQYGIGVRGTVQSVDWGPERIDLKTAVTPEDVATLDRAREALGIDMPEDGYGWFLGAYYG